MEVKIMVKCISSDVSDSTQQKWNIFSSLGRHRKQKKFTENTN